MSDIGGALTVYTLGKVASVPTIHRDEAQNDIRRRPDPIQSDPLAATPERTMSAGRVDETTLAGPPPSFKITQLELDERLAEDLARVNAERAFSAPDSTSTAPEGKDESDLAENLYPGSADNAKIPTSLERLSDPSDILTQAHGTTAGISAPLSVGETA